MDIVQVFELAKEQGWYKLKKSSPISIEQLACAGEYDRGVIGSGPLIYHRTFMVCSIADASFHPLRETVEEVGRS
jgi:hypothetical protein